MGKATSGEVRNLIWSNYCEGK